MWLFGTFEPKINYVIITPHIFAEIKMKTLKCV